MKKLLLKSILLLCALVVGTSSSWANSNTSTVSTKFSATGNITDQFTQTGDFTSAAWNLGVTWKDDASWQNLDGTKGAQIGSGSHPATGIVLTGSNISGTITSVVVNTSGSNSINATVAVTVGGTGFTCGGNATASLTSSAADYTFTGSGSGDIVITWTNSSSKAIYIKSITTTYTTGGGSTPSISLSSNSINATEEDGDGTITVTYNNIDNEDVDAEVLFYESNGTTPATYDWIIADINASNNLDYAYDANTGAARTAYMKVHQKNSEVYSGLISITQAAKTVASPTFSLETGSYITGTPLTITSAGNTIYYNIATDGSTPSDPTNGSTEYTGPIALGSGTNKIKAIAYDTYGNKSSIVTRTYTGIAPTTLPFSWTGTSSAGKDELAAKPGVVANLGTNFAASNAPYRLKFDAVGKFVFIYFNEKPEAVSFTAKLFNATTTGSIIKVQGSADGLNFTDVQSFTINDAAGATFEFTTTNAFHTNYRVVRLIMTTKDQNVAVGSINVTSNRAEPAEPVAAGETVTLTTTANMAGWRTYNNNTSKNYTIDGTTKVYYASATADGKVTLTEIADGVPANTPVILHQTSGTTITLTETATNISAPGSNLLQVSTASQNLGTVYRLGYKSAYGVGFYTYTTNSAPAGIIYLSSVSTARDYLEFTFDDETTGVADVRSKMSDGRSEYFNLAGQRVAQPTKGLYIVNGKKYVIK